MYNLTGSRRRGTLDGDHRLRGGFDRGLWDGEKAFNMGRHKRNSRLVINDRESNRGSSREWMSYPNWARSTVTGRLYRVYYTHGDYGRANTLKRRVVRQTRNLIRIGLLRSVRGLSWGLSGGVTVARVPTPGVLCRRVAFQPRFVLLPTAGASGSLVGAVPHIMFQSAKANKAFAFDSISLCLWVE